jgi:hypothetical protein
LRREHEMKDHTSQKISLFVLLYFLPCSPICLFTELLIYPGVW